MKCQAPGCENEVDGKARTCSTKCRKALSRLLNAKPKEIILRAPKCDTTVTVPDPSVTPTETVQERLAKTRPKGPWTFSVARNGKIEYWRSTARRDPAAAQSAPDGRSSSPT